MAFSLEENWQTSRSTLREKNKYMFNNPLISDIKFIVCDLDGKKITIPAHKYVLAIASPVFFAMFYGELSERKEFIEVPDCDAESFLEFLRYLYCDEVHLNGSCVISVMYLAEKYIVPSLLEKCSSFLERRLDCDNVFTVLPQAITFGDETLVKRCWEVADECAEDAITSEAFYELDSSLLEAVLERDSFGVEEVELFTAVDLWARKDCERNGWSTDRKSRRKALGNAINLIRFQVMTKNEFTDVVANSRLLTADEFSSLLSFFNSGQTPVKLGKNLKKRIRSLKVCKRFSEGNFSNTEDEDEPAVRRDAVMFNVNNAIYLHGVRLFGSPEGKYSVSFDFFRCQKQLSIHSVFWSARLGPFHSTFSGGYYGFYAPLQHAVKLEPRVDYLLRATVEGPRAHYGISGAKMMTCERVKFFFCDAGIFDNRALGKRGQIPELFFTTAS